MYFQIFLLLLENSRLKTSIVLQCLPFDDGHIYLFCTVIISQTAQPITCEIMIITSLKKQQNIYHLNTGQAVNIADNEGAGSDDEDERKGGMQKKEIQIWLWEVSQFKDNFERVLDYPRYRDGPKKDQIIIECDDAN